MLFRGKTRICREGWYYLLVLAFVVTGSILRDVNLLMVMSGMMLFPFLFNWRAVIAGLRGLQLQRSLPRSVAAGDLLVVNVELKKRRLNGWFGGHSSWAVAVEDTIRNESMPSEPAARSAKLLFWRVDASQPQRLSYQARLHRRGQYRLGPASISTGFPLGLVRRTVKQNRSDGVIVLPKPGHLTGKCVRLYQQSHLGSQSSRHKSGPLEGDFHSLRDWRPGDGRRWIHWRTTARRGIPVVRLFEQHHEQDLALLVDLWHPEAPREADWERVEQTISLAATIIADVCRRGNSYLYVGSTGKETNSRGGASSSGLMQDLLEQLAVAAADSEDRLPESLATALDVIRPGMTILLLSPRIIDIAQLEADAGLWSNPQRRAAAGRIECIHTGGGDLSEYFHMDTHEDAAVEPT